VYEVGLWIVADAAAPQDEGGLSHLTQLDTGDADIHGHALYVEASGGDA
jgi:hypothetical protein